MKKVLIIIGLAISTMSFGQKNATVNFGVGTQTLACVGSLSQTHNFSVGESVQVECQPKGKFSYTLSVGYNNIVGKSNVKSINQIPIMVAPKLHIKPDFSIGIAGGISIYDQNLGTQFTYSPFITYGTGNLSFDVKWLTSTKNGENLTGFGLGAVYTFK